MSPKMRRKLEELEAESRKAAANGDPESATRLRTQINNLRALCEDTTDAVREGGKRS